MADPCYQLRETVEAFEASNGHIYFLRGADRAEQVLRSPTDHDRALLRALHQPTPHSQLVAALGTAAEGSEKLDASLRDLLALGLVETVEKGRTSPVSEDAQRYDRQLAYFTDTAGTREMAWAHQRRLAEASVVILGCGGLGSWAACGLACAGVGELVLVDDDTVELSNLNRQLLFRPSDLGRPKVEAAREALSAFNPQLTLRDVRRRVTSGADVRELVRGADLVIATADEPPYEIARWVNQACAAERTPWTSAGQFPPHLRVGPMIRPPQTGCWECQEIAARRDFPLYDELIDYRRRRRVNAATLGPASGIIGSALAMDAIYCLTGLNRPATQGRALIIDLRTMAVTAEEVPREEGCPTCSTAATGREW